MEVEQRDGNGRGWLSALVRSAACPTRWRPGLSAARGSDSQIGHEPGERLGACAAARAHRPARSPHVDMPSRINHLAVVHEAVPRSVDVHVARVEVRRERGIGGEPARLLDGPGALRVMDAPRDQPGRGTRVRGRSSLVGEGVPGGVGVGDAVAVLVHEHL